MGGVESPRSSPLTINTPGNAETGQDGGGLTTTTKSGTWSTCNVQPNCFDVHVLAEDLTNASALTVAPDGRLFFVENEAQVRVIADGFLVSEPALKAPAHTRIVSMAIDESQFANRHLVYVAYVQESSGLGAELSITRFRELNDSFGEGATILTGLSVPMETIAPLAVDNRGLVYVAIPATPGPVPLIESGVVLRFTGDGQVPDSNPGFSPVLAMGLSKPTGLAVDALGQSVWVAGWDASSGVSIAKMPFAQGEAASSEQFRLQALRRGPVRSNPGVFFAKGSPGASLPMILMDGNLHYLGVGASKQIVTQDQIKLANGAPVVNAVGGLHRSIYVVTGQDPSSILQLVPPR
jgi:hypothetical protein